LSFFALQPEYMGRIDANGIGYHRLTAHRASVRKSLSVAHRMIALPAEEFDGLAQNDGRRYVQIEGVRRPLVRGAPRDFDGRDRRQVNDTVATTTMKPIAPHSSSAENTSANELRRNHGTMADVER